MTDGQYETANTMDERAGESGMKLWLLVEANRLVVTAVLSTIVFVAFVLAGVTLRPPFESAIAEADTIETLFSAMLGAVITGVTLVVTISQLVISQENGPLGDQHKRMSDALDFREYLGEHLDHAIPPTPSAFLKTIVETTEQHARRLQESVAATSDAEFKADVEEFTNSVIGNAQQVRERLDRSEFGTFDVVSAALNFNYSVNIYFVEELTSEYEEMLTDEQQTQFDELKTSLSMFGPAREHIKTLYFEWELIDLSKMILYAGISALLVSGLMLTFVGSGTFPGDTANIANIVWVVSGAFTLTLVPFLLLTAYILRIAVVAKRTLAVGPLVLRELD